MHLEHSPEVAAVVSFELASQACRERVERADERLVSVQLLGARLRVHRSRVDALAGNGSKSEA